MKKQHVITGNADDKAWQQIGDDLTKDQNLFEYDIIIDKNHHKVSLDIEVDMGGGFESGYSTTIFSAQLNELDFKFAVHEEHFIDEIGKFFGIEDIVIGYTELDKHLIIKTNDADKMKYLFSNPKARAVFEKLENFHFGIVSKSIDNSSLKVPYLELFIEEGITDPVRLKELYEAFYSILIHI
ncbi:hypothetical protein KXQ82_07410 [Mucilaginibacter sp. HMF5004]|uniref:hypothetical protein n=1 Tax=Mucilaginibacter rivuli TaxID=2857527 RepID=UPI001C5FF554|nr:hypothetical protein [Mucilaginibacter rivuli]MBW4889536.1 hypothetical protein [Mucilaginibacter rivuli]